VTADELKALLPSGLGRHSLCSCNTDSDLVSSCFGCREAGYNHTVP